MRSALGVEVAVRAWWGPRREEAELRWLRSAAVDAMALRKAGVPERILEAGWQLGDFLRRDLTVANIWSACGDFVEKADDKPGQFLASAVKYVTERFEIVVRAPHLISSKYVAASTGVGAAPWEGGESRPPVLIISNRRETQTRPESATFESLAVSSPRAPSPKSQPGTQPLSVPVSHASPRGTQCVASPSCEASEDAGKLRSGDTEKLLDNLAWRGTNDPARPVIELSKRIADSAGFAAKRARGLMDQGVVAKRISLLAESQGGKWRSVPRHTVFMWEVDAKPDFEVIPGMQGHCSAEVKDAKSNLAESGVHDPLEDGAVDQDNEKGVKSEEICFSTNSSDDEEDAEGLDKKTLSSDALARARAKMKLDEKTVGKIEQLKQKAEKLMVKIDPNSCMMGMPRRASATDSENEKVMRDTLARWCNLNVRTMEGRNRTARSILRKDVLHDDS